MHNVHIKKIKKQFVIINILFTVLLIGTSIFLVSISLKEILVINLNSVAINLKSLNYKFSFAYAGNENLTASIASIFNNGLIIENNNSIAESVPVLLYHGVIENPDGSNILLEDFKNQMFALKKDGWQAVSIDDFYQFTKGGKELPDKSFLLTFDDGRKDSYYPVDPILKALDYSAVMFVITKYSLNDKSGSYYLSKSELKRMIKTGRWEIEAHTREGHDTYKISPDGREGHFYSNKLWLDDEQRIETEEEFKERIYRDLAAAKNELEDTFNIKVNSFAYPFGDFGQGSINFPEAERIISDAVKSIYPMSFYQVWPGRGFSFNYPDSDESLIKRIDVKPDWSPNALVALLDAGKEKPLPYFDNFEKYNGWIRSWGDVIFGDNLITIGASESSNGGFVFLDGSRLWKNYIFKADARFQKGQTYSIVAGYKDNSNYVFCSFTPSGIRLEQMVGGERKTLNEFKGKFNLLNKEKNISIGLAGTDAACYLEGKRIIDTSDVDEKLSMGGIGFKTWDPQADSSEMVVKEIVVSDINKETSVLATLQTYQGKALAKTTADEEEQQLPEQIQPIEVKNDDTENETAPAPQAVARELFLFDSDGAPTPYKINRFTPVEPWKSVFGKMFIRDETLHIGANASSTASLAVLSGSEEWADYLFEATVDWLKGASFSLVARYKDSKNHAICGYSSYGAYARLYLVSGGKTVTIGRSPRLSVPYVEPWKDRKFAVSVNGDEIQCLIGNEVILRYSLLDMPKAGGIGFKTWDPQVDNSEVVVKSISIEEIK